LSIAKQRIITISTSWNYKRKRATWGSETAEQTLEAKLWGRENLRGGVAKERKIAEGKDPSIDLVRGGEKRPKGPELGFRGAEDEKAAESERLGRRSRQGPEHPPSRLTSAGKSSRHRKKVKVGAKKLGAEGIQGSQTVGRLCLGGC